MTPIFEPYRAPFRTSTERDMARFDSVVPCRRNGVRLDKSVMYLFQNQAPLLLPPLISAGSSHSSHAHRRYVVLDNTTQQFLQRSKRLSGTAGVVVMQRPPRARAYAAAYQETAPGAAVAAPGSAAVASPDSAAVASPSSAVAAVPASGADAGVSGGRYGFRLNELLHKKMFKMLFLAALRLLEQQLQRSTQRTHAHRALERTHRATQAALSIRLCNPWIW